MEDIDTGYLDLLTKIQENNSKLAELSSYLTELESQLSLVFAAVPDMALLVDTTGKILNVNNQGKQILGYEIRDLKQKNIYDFVHPDDIEKTVSVFNTLLNHENVVLQDNFFVNRWRRYDGCYVWLAWRFSFFSKEKNTLIGFATTFNIVNDEGSPFSYRLIKKSLDCAKDGIVITDNTGPDNVIIYVNESFCRSCGYDKGELLGINCRILQSDDREQAALNTLRDALATGKSCEVLLRNYTKDKRVFFNHLIITPVEEHGLVTNFIGVSKNVTDLVEKKYYIWNHDSPTGFEF